MSDTETRRSLGLSFSLGHLLTFTTLIAVLIAVGLAYRKNRMLTQQLDALLSLSSRLKIHDKDSLASNAMPAVADDFHSWQVYIPEGTDYELRLGIGAVTKKGIPPNVGSVRMTPGQHRVTFLTRDSSSEEFRYVVYVDGIQVIETTMGSNWIPGGWSSSSSIDWPREPKLSPTPLQLAAQSYEQRFNFGSNQYLNGQKDDFVTRLGYRLWIDQSDRSYQAVSPFIGFPGDDPDMGIGLRDGLRFSSLFNLTYPWIFTRPKLATIDHVFQLGVDFFISDDVAQSSQSQSFQSWQMRSDVGGREPLQWKEDPSQTTQTAFLHPTLKSEVGLNPVIEMCWDTGRPDEVGLRLADTLANKEIIRWQLSILGGSHHLWRELRIGDGSWVSASEVIKQSDAHNSLANASKRNTILDLDYDSTANVRLQWQTNEKLPLQIVERTVKSHAGMGLYTGLPVILGIQIPATSKPILTVDIADQLTNVPSASIPGGPVFDEIHIDLNAVDHDWIWLNSRMKD